MIITFEKFLLLLEKNQVEVIKKFCNVPEIYNWAQEFSPKFSVWFANVVKNLLLADKEFGDWIDPVKHEQNVQEFLKIGVYDFENSNKDKIDSLNIIQNKIKKFTTDRTYLNKYVTVLDWLKSPLRTENVDLSRLTFEQALKMSEDWHKNLQATGVIANEEGVIFMTFSDGFYWIDLETSSSRDEANAMGHCGTTNGDTLLSLRKNQEPHVTAAYRYSGEILQMKGKGNTKPLEKYHKYVIELLCYPKVSKDVKIPKTENNYKIKGFEYEYNPEDDFNMESLTKDQLKYIFERNPELFSSYSMKYFLYKEKLITVEEFMNNCQYSDLILKDGKVYFKLEQWSDIDAFKQDRNMRDGWIQRYLSGESDWEGYSEMIPFEYNYYWSDLSNDAYEAIIKKVEGLTITVNDNELDKEYDFTFTKKNTIVTKRDVTVKLKYKKTVSLGDILNDNVDDFEIESSELDDVRDDLGWAYTNAQESADQSEAYDDIIKSIENSIGRAVRDEKGHVSYKDGGILINIDLGFIKDLSQIPETEGCKTVLDLINYGLKEYNDGDDLIRVSQPQYGWQGTVTAAYLSEEIVNRL